MEKKSVDSILKFNQTYFPDSILDRLENRLYHSLPLEEGAVHHSHNYKGNKKTSILEIDNPSWTSEEDVLMILENFYENEGYKTKRQGRIVEAKRENVGISRTEEAYQVLLTKASTGYLIQITKPALKKPLPEICKPRSSSLSKHLYSNQLSHTNSPRTPLHPISTHSRPVGAVIQNR